SAPLSLPGVTRQSVILAMQRSPEGAKPNPGRSRRVSHASAPHFASAFALRASTPCLRPLNSCSVFDRAAAGTPRRSPTERQRSACGGQRHTRNQHQFRPTFRAAEGAHARGVVMRAPRRGFLRFAAGAAAVTAVSRFARAQAYPTRPVHLIAGFAPGGIVDIMARLIGQWLSERLGQSFIIENRTGAGSNLAAGFVARANPDGYTLQLVSPVNPWNTRLYQKLDFDFMRGIVPVASIERASAVMEVTPTVPAKTVPEFIAYAKANPGKINMASAGPGSGPHLFGELFKVMAGVDLFTVHYRGSG